MATYSTPQKAKVCCCCDMRMGVMSANGLIVAIFIVIAILQGTGVGDQQEAFKDCNDYCQADAAGRQDILVKAGGEGEGRKCYFDDWMVNDEGEASAESDTCKALAYGQSDKAKQLALVGLVFGIVWLITALCAIAGAATFNFTLVKVQMCWLPVNVLIQIITTGITGSELNKYDYDGKGMALSFLSVGVIVGVLIAAGLFYADKELTKSGFTKQNYAQHKNCCSGNKSQPQLPTRLLPCRPLLSRLLLLTLISDSSAYRRVTFCSTESVVCGLTVFSLVFSLERKRESGWDVAVSMWDCCLICF